MAGHRIISPLDYLIDRKVNIIVQPIRTVIKDTDLHVWMRTAGWDYIYRYFMDVDKPINGEYISEATLFALPMENGYYNLIWYIQPHPDIDRIIFENRLMTVKLRR